MGTFPALEFVKAVCKVLQVDSALGDEVRKLRRNLLKLINVGEFDGVAEWRDPCISFVLAEVICRACNHCRDIDLCKDPHKGEKDGKPVFLCANNQCRAAYEPEDIEAMLIDSLQRKMMGYSLQDLACSKCNEVTASNMSRRCKCAGEYKTTVNVVNIGEILKAFHGLAEHYHMPLLLEQVNWMFKLSPEFAHQYEIDISTANNNGAK